ncbi:MAG TPA: hypothetical protein EYP65_08525 [Armatimonadetes bacterium]|nr:hypothetical protein [Armatimonadota bacterium]
MAQRAEVGEASVEARLARLEGAVAQMDKRVSDLREDMNRRFDKMEAEIREVRGRFWWVIGILVTMWVSIIIAVLLGR